MVHHSASSIHAFGLEVELTSLFQQYFPLSGSPFTYRSRLHATLQRRCSYVYVLGYFTFLGRPKTLYGLQHSDVAQLLDKGEVHNEEPIILTCSYSCQQQMQGVTHDYWNICKYCKGSREEKLRRAE